MTLTVSSREYKRIVADSNELIIFRDYLRHIGGYVTATTYDGTTGYITIYYRFMELQ